jgi:hypothetical protein
MLVAPIGESSAPLSDEEISRVVDLKSGVSELINQSKQITNINDVSSSGAWDFSTLFSTVEELSIGRRQQTRGVLDTPSCNTSYFQNSDHTHLKKSTPRDNNSCCSPNIRGQQPVAAYSNNNGNKKRATISSAQTQRFTQNEGISTKNFSSSAPSSSISPRRAAVQQDQNRPSRHHVGNSWEGGGGGGGHQLISSNKVGASTGTAGAIKRNQQRVVPKGKLPLFSINK